MDFIIKRVAYVSRSTLPLGHRSDLDILRVSIAAKCRLGLSGFLFRGPQDFVQILEGDSAHLTKTLTRILQDRRHFDVRVVLDTPIADRRFYGWTMGYACLGDAAAKRLLSLATASPLDETSFLDMTEHLAREHAGAQA